jgi:hypothetical protein
LITVDAVVGGPLDIGFDLLGIAFSTSCFFSSEAL